MPKNAQMSVRDLQGGQSWILAIFDSSGTCPSYVHLCPRMTISGTAMKSFLVEMVESSANPGNPCRDCRNCRYCRHHSYLVVDWEKLSSEPVVTVVTVVTVNTVVIVET